MLPYLNNKIHPNRLFYRGVGSSSGAASHYTEGFPCWRVDIHDGCALMTDFLDESSIYNDM